MSNPFIGFGAPSPEMVEAASERVRELTSREINGSDPTSHDIYDLVNHGSFSALYIPAVKTAVDTTLDVIADPTIQEHLDREVCIRTFVMRVVADLTIKTLVDDNYPEEHFRQNSLLGTLPLRVINDEHFKLKMTMASLAGSPFVDMSKVCGGVLALLEEKGITDESPLEVVKRSKKLMLAGRLDKRYALGANRTVGIPYVQKERLQIEEGDEGIEVAFTPETERYLKDRLGIMGGCPAGAVHPEGADGPSMFEIYWSKIAEPLLPHDAVADYDEAMIRERLQFK